MLSVKGALNGRALIGVVFMRASNRIYASASASVSVSVNANARSKHSKCHNKAAGSGMLGREAG